MIQFAILGEKLKENGKLTKSSSNPIEGKSFHLFIGKFFIFLWIGEDKEIMGIQIQIGKKNY